MEKVVRAKESKRGILWNGLDNVLATERHGNFYLNIPFPLDREVNVP